MKRLEPSVHLEAVVDAPPSAVLDVLADWRKNLLWEQELRESEPVTPEPVTPSRSVSAPAALGSAARRWRIGVVEITECVSPRLLVSEVPIGPMRFRSATRLAPAADGTRTVVRSELKLRPRGVLRLLVMPGDVHRYGLRESSPGPAGANGLDVPGPVMGTAFHGVSNTAHPAAWSA
jgi:hypothetical protein